MFQRRSTSRSSSNNRIECQIYKQYQEAQAQIQYYVYQDLQNVVNLLYVMRAVVSYFKEDLLHPMINLCYNNLVLQLNRTYSSNNYYIQQSLNNQQNKEFLNQQKQKAKKILDQLLNSMSEFKNFNLTEQLDLIESYKNNSLDKYLRLFSNSQKQTNYSNQFNELSTQIINSMQSIDNQLNQEGFDGKFKQPTIAEIHYKALMYEQLIQNKLQLNFPHFNNSLVEMYCPISNHNHKKISHVCLNQFCSNFRLNCFDCSQDGNHCAHHKDQKEIIELKNFIETKALEYQDTVKKINNLQNQLIQMFDEVKLNIQQQYDISFNMLNQMDIFQINDTLQNLIQFNTHLDPSYEIISNNTQHLVNSLNEFIQAIQENQKSNTTCFQEKIMKNNKLNDLQNHSDQSNQFGDYNQEKSNNFIKDYVNIAKINQSPQFSNGQYISNEQYSNNLNNQQQLQNKLIEFLKKFELPINNNTHPTIQNILNSINNNYEKLKEDIKKLKLSYNPNSKFKTYADYAIRQLPSGNLREQFRLHQIFHLFYSYLDAEKKNGRIINIFEYLAYVKISQQNDFGNFLIYFEQQKCILQKQPHFVNQQNSQNLNNQLYWQDDYYYELFKNFSNIYGYQII